MRKQLPKLRAEHIMGAAALPEITAMARIGGFEIGKSLTRAEVRSLRRDASRARRRGNRDRSDELERRAARHEQLLARIETEQKLELARAPVASADELLVTGRVTDRRRLEGRLRVDLMGAGGKSLAHDVTDEFGFFTLRAPGSGADAAASRIVVSDGKGGTLRAEAAPVLNPGRPVYVVIDLVGATPSTPTEPPDAETSEQLVEVPAVTGLPAKDAVARMKSVGLDAKTGEREVSGAEPGTVVRQAPAAGSRVPGGSSVELVVAASRGPKAPGLTGQTLRTIAKKLSELELKLGKVELVHDPDNAGKVVEQAPPKGSPVSPGTAISLRVATGKDKADMQVATTLAVADARGVELKLAEKALAKALRDAEVTNVAELGEFAKRPAAEIAERLEVTGRGRAAAARSLLADVARRFPRT